MLKYKYFTDIKRKRKNKNSFGHKWLKVNIFKTLFQVFLPIWIFFSVFIVLREMFCTYDKNIVFWANIL